MFVLPIQYRTYSLTFSALRGIEMSGLTEKYVQDVSLDFLRRHYEDKYKPSKMFCRKEVVTKYKNKKGRADGFIAFRNEGRIYTVSLEAKSHKTLDTLFTKYNDFAPLSLGLIMLCVVSALTSLLLWKFNWVIRFGISASAGIVSGIVFIRFIDKKAIFKKHGIIEQVRRYPANEQWIAFSKDAYNFFNETNDFELKMRAKRYGIGIIVVNSGKKASIELEASERKFNSKINFLKYYSIGARIGKELS